LVDRGRTASQTGQWLWQESLRAEENQAEKSPRCADQEALRKPPGIAENQAKTGVLAGPPSWLGSGSLQPTRASQGKAIVGTTPESVAGTSMLTLNHESLQCWLGHLHAFVRQRQSTMSYFPAAVPFSAALLLFAHSSRRSLASTPNKWPSEAAFFPATVKRRWCWPAASSWLPSSRDPEGPSIEFGRSRATHGGLTGCSASVNQGGVRGRRQ